MVNPGPGTRPLVSVMMPCYNSTSTLPRALASLVAQTYEDWECLLIDDGSADRPLELVARLGDPRIKAMRLDRNAGRGAARQVALDRAEGDLICMLDADDWIYPTKIDRQVEALRDDPRLALVSTGFAIVDGRDELVGVRARPPDGPLRVLGPVTRLTAPWIPFGASMIRTSLARRVGFDARLSACEDMDFLIRLLWGRRYCILPEASYVYREHVSITIEKMVLTLRLSRGVFMKHRDRFPIRSRLNAGRSIAKEVAYRAGFALGLGDYLVRRRSLPPSAADRAEFLTARRIVAHFEGHLFQRVGLAEART